MCPFVWVPDELKTGLPDTTPCLPPVACPGRLATTTTDAPLRPPPLPVVVGEAVVVVGGEVVVVIVVMGVVLTATALAGPLPIASMVP